MDIKKGLFKKFQNVDHAKRLAFGNHICDLISEKMKESDPDENNSHMLTGLILSLLRFSLAHPNMKNRKEFILERAKEILDDPDKYFYVGVDNDK